MPIPFEQLWEQCEGLQKAGNQSFEQVLDELMMKINLYKICDSKSEMSELDRHAIKVRALGEVLFTITKLSLKDNINIYEALAIALQHRS